MKKLMLILIASLLPLTFVYAETDTDLFKKEISTTVKAEIATAVKAGIDTQIEEVKDKDKILQEYIDICDGNEKLGKILYDKRKGKTAKQMHLESMF